MMDSKDIIGYLATTLPLAKKDGEIFNVRRFSKIEGDYVWVQFKYSKHHCGWFIHLWDEMTPIAGRCHYYPSGKKVA